MDLNEPEVESEGEAIEEANDQEQSDAQPEPEISKPSEGGATRKRKPRKE